MSTNPPGTGVLAASQKPTLLKIGVSGHQKREGADWTWVGLELANTLRAYNLPLEGWTSLAAGADQIFARAILDRGGTLVTVIPKVNYEKDFTELAEIEEYHRLLNASQQIIRLDDHVSDRAFLSAGKLIVDECHLMVAIWDGNPSKGLGGTADVVEYAKSLGRRLIILNPIKKTTISNI